MTGTLLVAGAGHIGKAIAHLLSRSKSCKVVLTDLTLKHVPEVFKKTKSIKLVEIDINNQAEMSALIEKEKVTAIVSCLPFFCNKDIAETALKHKLQYFDLTEDVETIQFIRSIANDAGTVFVPQCGLAPGFINIIAHDLMQQFETLESVKLRCGGLPINTTNALKYAFTWSIDGLINEYNKPCEAIKNGELTTLASLENLEEIQIDGLKYEAFNTSGGIGSLPHTYRGKVNTLNYKSMRYPGHRDLMRFLMQDLKLGQDVETLRKIILKAIPHTTKDVVIIYVAVSGEKEGKLSTENFVKKYYPAVIDELQYSALQIITAASASAVIRLVMHNPKKFKGYVEQEFFKLDELMDSPFKQYLEGKK